MKRSLLFFCSLAVCLVITAVPAMAQGKFPTNKPDVEAANQLTDQEKADGWKLLFNGENLDGMTPDAGEWRVEDGIIISEKGTCHLFSNEKYKNLMASWWVCAYDVAVPKRRYGNSGVFLRGIKGRDGSFPKGYEVQVDPYDIKNPTGGIYGQSPGTLLVENGAWKPAAFLAVQEGKWAHQKAYIKDNHIKVWINGELTLDWTDEKNQFPEAGYLAFQNHHKTDVVLFTGIKIKVLDE